MGISSLNSGNTEITDNKSEAEILSNQFKAVFADEDVDTIPKLISGTQNYRITVFIRLTALGAY